MPIVSVLMTAYNREKYIAEAIESVLTQTFTDFELIIVDDGSKDTTVEIARRYTEDPRVRVHVNEKNLGDYLNRNRAASLAEGQYLKYLDSDDVLYPHGLEVMVDAMRKFPSAVLALQRLRIEYPPHPVLLSSEQAFREQFLGDGLFGVGPSATIILASAFRSVGGFSAKRFVGDFELWLKLASRYPVLKLNEDLVFWRSHGGQEISTEHGVFPYGTAAYPVYREALSSEDCPLNPADRKQALRWCKYRQARVLIRVALLECRPGKAMRIMREIGLPLRDLMLAFAPVKKPGVL